jgi:glycosyltransferase involved in cell wall biosynthesis
MWGNQAGDLSMLDVLFDARWIGNHGIGRYASCLQRALPELRPFNSARRPWHPFDPVLLGATLWVERPNIFFSPGYNAPSGWPFPFIFTLCDLNHLVVAENGGLAKQAYYSNFIRPACRKAKAVLTLSAFSKQAILEWSGIHEDKIKVVPPGVAFPFVPEGKRFDPGFPYFLYVGNRKAHKNLDRLLKAYANSAAKKDIRLVLTGPSDAEIAYKVAALGIRNHTTFVDSPDDELLAELYRGAKALLFPSLYEGFGLPPLEAMACGIPVLVSHAGAVREVVGDAGVLVDGHEVDAIADGIDRVVGDESLRATLIKRGFVRAQEFSWDQAARLVREVIRKAASQ